MAITAKDLTGGDNKDAATVLILRGTAASGTRVAAGEVVTISGKDARYLVATKKATFDLPEKPKKASRKAKE